MSWAKKDIRSTPNIYTCILWKTQADSDEILETNVLFLNHYFSHVRKGQRGLTL